MGGTGLAVSAFSKHIESAMDFTYWVASADVQRGPFAANAEHDSAPSGVFTVSARGSLTLGLFIVTPAGAATVPANGAQIAATLI